MSGTCCVIGTIHPGQPVGTEGTLAGLNTYSVGPEDAAKVVVIAPDIFGWEFVNNRLLADAYAKGGFRVHLVDFFGGVQFPQWGLTTIDPVQSSSRSFYQTYILTPLLLLSLGPFLFFNRPSVQEQRHADVLAALRAQGGGKKVGLAGFCFGGRWAIRLNSSYDATFAAHPSLVAYPGELEGVKNPISFCLAEHDHGFDAARGLDAEARLRAGALKGQEEKVECRVYKEVVHGFTCRGDPSKEVQRRAMEDSTKQAVDWFQRWL